MNPQLPATEQTYNEKATENLFIVSENNGFYTIDIPAFLEIYPGLEANFFNQIGNQIGRGFVTNVGLNSALCRSHHQLSEKPNFVRLNRVWSFAVQQITLRSNICFTQPQPFNQKCVLSVYCKVPTEHTGGLLSWSLFYSPIGNLEEVKVLDGHDYYTKPGLCYYEHSGLWNAGNYRIKVQRYHFKSAILLSEDTQNWSLLESSSRLSCGGYDDPLSMLLL